MQAVKQALQSIRRSPYQALAAVIILFVTFFVGNALVLLLLGSQKLVHFFSSQPQVTAYFQQDTQKSVLEGYAETLRKESFVKQVTLVDQEQALEIYRKQTSNDPLLQELVTADILPPSLEVSTQTLEDQAKTAELLAKFSGVDEVVYQKDVVENLQFWTRLLQQIGLGVLLLFVATSVLVIVTITSLRVASKKGEIRIQRLLGATQWYVLRPFLIEGALYGFIGATLGWAAVTIGLLYASPFIQAFVAEVRLVPVPLAFFALQWVVGVGAGIILGAISAAGAARRLVRV